jgi:hypothetical protein
VPAGLDHQVTEAPAAQPGDVDVHRLGQLGVVRDPDGEGLTGLAPGDGRDPVLRGERLDGVRGDGLDHDTVGTVRVDLDGLGAGLVGEQCLQGLDRGEAPLLFTAVRHREVGHVVRRGALAPGLQRHRRTRSVGVRLVAGGDQGFGG